MTDVRPRLSFMAAALPGTLGALVLEAVSARNPWGPYRFTLFDDAMISMSYARTLAVTGHLTWFDGAARVEGFTNPLWTLWMSVIHITGLHSSAAALAVSLSAIGCVFAAAVVAGCTVAAVGSRRAGHAAAFLVPLCFPTVYWSLRGMEVGLIALCMVVMFAVVVRSATTTPLLHGPELVSAAVVVGVWTRFDFVVVAGATIASAWASGLLRFRTDVVRAIAASIFVSSLSVLTWQKAYYGNWLPNTYVLKMSGVSAVDRAVRGVAASGRSVIILAVLALVLARSFAQHRPNRRMILVGSTAVVAAAGYSVYVGGDAWENVMLNRFMASCLPLVVMAVCIGATERDRPARWDASVWLSGVVVVVGSVASLVMVNPFGFDTHRAAPQALVTVALLLGGWVVQRQRGRASTEWHEYMAGAMVVVVSAVPFFSQIVHRDALLARTNLYVTATVETLSPALRDDAVVATVWAGVPAYYLGTPMIDLLGKNDAHVARTAPQASFFPGHNKWDYAYSVGLLRPDVVFQVFQRGDGPAVTDSFPGWGYERRCMTSGVFPVRGVWVRKDSTRVSHDLLVDCSS